MNCRRCGAQNAEGSQYCVKCGKPLCPDQCSSLQGASPQDQRLLEQQYSHGAEGKKVAWYNTATAGIVFTLIVMIVAIAMWQNHALKLGLLAIALIQGFRVIANYLKK